MLLENAPGAFDVAAPKRGDDPPMMLDGLRSVAGETDVRRLVPPDPPLEGGVLLGIGLVLGIVAAMAGSRLIQGLLFGVPPHDPVTLGLVAGIMAAIGIGACWLPAARAARIDPAIAMRGQ